MSDDADRGPGFITGLLLGALVGITLAMIVAPEAGADNGEVVEAKARETADGVREAADDLRETANELLERGRRIVDAARARFDEAVAEGKSEAAAFRSTLENGS